MVMAGIPVPSPAAQSNSQIEWKVTDIVQAITLNHRTQYFQEKR